jgi:hypothetical protein
MTVLLLTAALTSTVLVLVDEVSGLGTDEASALSMELANAIEHRAGVKAQLSSRSGRCPGDEDECLERLRTESIATEIVVARVHAAVTVVRVTLRRPGRSALRFDLSTDPLLWRASFDKAANALFAAIEAGASAERPPSEVLTVAPQPHALLRPCTEYFSRR